MGYRKFAKFCYIQLFLERLYYFSGLACAVLCFFPTTFLKIAVCTFAFYLKVYQEFVDKKLLFPAIQFNLMSAILHQGRHILRYKCKRCDNVK